VFLAKPLPNSLQFFSRSTLFAPLANRFFDNSYHIAFQPLTKYPSTNVAPIQLKHPPFILWLWGLLEAKKADWRTSFLPNLLIIQYYFARSCCFCPKLRMPLPSCRPLVQPLLSPQDKEEDLIMRSLFPRAKRLFLAPFGLFNRFDQNAEKRPHGPSFGPILSIILFLLLCLDYF